MPPNPPSTADGFTMRSMSLCDMQIPKSEKKILAPPLPNPGDAPASSVNSFKSRLDNYRHQIGYGFSQT